MINILFDCPNEQLFYRELCEYIKPCSRVAVIAFSFYDDYVKCADDWDRVYGKGLGHGYFELVDSLTPYGIREEDISFVDYFRDSTESASDKIRSADILYFTGGLPDRMMERIEERGLLAALKAHDGVVMGYSAGAVIQLGEYHLSPDADYSEFGYYRGIGYVDGFYMEVHYEGRKQQDEAVRRVIAERGSRVYVSHTACGGIVVDDVGRVKKIGNIDEISP